MQRLVKVKAEIIKVVKRLSKPVKVILIKLVKKVVKKIKYQQKKAKKAVKKIENQTKKTKIKFKIICQERILIKLKEDHKQPFLNYLDQLRLWKAQLQ